MNDNTIRGLASIIVPCWNQFTFTQQCIAALRQHTREPWELIVVDNGSTDKTPTYLTGVRDMAGVPVTVISNATNLGFPAAINQGLREARGEYLVLLNNDVVVTDGWLDQLTALANAKNDSTADSGARGERRPSVNPGAGSGDRRPTGVNPGAGSGDPRPTGVNPGAGSGDPRPTGVNPGAGSGGPRPTNFEIIELDADGAELPESRNGAGLAPDFGSTLPNPIGLVGPMSNYAAPPQLVDGVPYGDMNAMHHFARRWRSEHLGQWFTVPKLSGFCLLMKRPVYDKIGGLDERFGIGFFDDDDLAERARRAGFELAVAHDLFVHHFGSRTFVGNGIDADKLLDENARRFAAKWGLNGANGRRVSLRPFVADRAPSSDIQRTDSPAGRQQPERMEDLPHVPEADRARVSLTMIVKDEEKNLGACLASVRGIFDEIIVVDTGSSDRTVEIARSFGAKVFEFAWVDSFSAARNEALSHATGDYAFWLDADDVVDPDQRDNLRALLASLRRPGGVEDEASTQAAFVVRCACDPSPDGTGGETVVDHIRLFPLRGDVRWTYRVHEQILPALRQAGVPVRWTDLTIRHTGYVDPALRARKLERDMRLLYLDLQDRPDDPFVLFNLGAIAIERHEWNEAIGFLERSLKGSAPSDSIVRKLFALIARAHQMLGDSGEALATCARGLEVDRDDAELWFRKAVVHRQRGESNFAEQCWRRILTLRRPNQFCSVDQGIFGHLTRRNLAILAAERGDMDEASRLWNDVITECPGDLEAMARLQQMRVPISLAPSIGFS